jgi:hypothetical protein
MVGRNGWLWLNERVGRTGWLPASQISELVIRYALAGGYWLVV